MRSLPNVRVLNGRAAVEAPRAPETAERQVATGTFAEPLARQARDTLRQQAAAIESLANRVGPEFGAAVRLLSAVAGHVVVTGLGKSGLIGRKIAATLASTGTPSFFVHSTDALHGDLGMITPGDAVIAISYSGETEEVVQLVDYLRRRGVATVALVGNPISRLGRACDVVLDVSVESEICPLNLAPTSSTLTTLAMGDALTAAIMRLRGFDREDFAAVHPGGSLGRQLALAHEAALRDEVAVLDPEDTVTDCILAMTSSELGIALVIEKDRLVGMVSSSELQKAMSGRRETLAASVSTIMNRDVPVVDGDVRVTDADRRMEREGLSALVVLDESGGVCGVLPRSRGRSKR